MEQVVGGQGVPSEGGTLLPLRLSLFPMESWGTTHPSQLGKLKLRKASPLALALQHTRAPGSWLLPQDLGGFLDLIPTSLAWGSGNRQPFWAR